MDSIDPLAWSILLTAAGCALLVLEVFLPSGGVLSILSAAAFVAGIIIAFWTGGPSTGFTFITIVIIAGPTAMALAFAYLPHTPFGKHLLGEAPTEEEVAPNDPRRELIGRIGVARSKMLPSGAVEIEGHMLDAVAKGQAIEPGQNVKVVEVRGNRVIVRLTNETVQPGTPAASELLSMSIEELGIDTITDPSSLLE